MYLTVFFADRFLCVCMRDECPKFEHCELCDILDTSAFLNPDELETIGCCGLEDECLAFLPIIDTVLANALTDATLPLNENKRYYCYISTYQQAATDVGEQRRVFLCCVLHRIRCTFPNADGTPYTGHLSVERDLNEPQSGEEEGDEDEGDEEEGEGDQDY